MADARLTVLSVRKLVQGSPLNQSVSTVTPNDGGRLKVEAVTDFEPDGGEAVFEPGTARQEPFGYSGIDEATDELTGVVRPNTKYTHASGTFVQEGAEATIEKWADGRVDDEDEIGFFPVPPRLYPFLRVGAYDEDTAPTIPITYNEDDDYLYVSDGPLGEIPTYDEDLEVLPEAGIKIWANEEIAQTVQPIGLGDGAAPVVPGSAPVITQGPNMHLIDMRAYVKPDDWLAFVIEFSTNGGGAWTSLGDSGSNVFAHTNLTLGTNYRYRFSVRDSEGNLTSPSPSSIDYAARGVGTADLVIGSVTADILAATITISNTFQTSAAGSRVVFDGSGIRLINSGGTTVADLNAATGIATLIGSVYKSATGTGSRVELDSSGLRFYDSSNVLKVELKTSDSSASFLGAITSGSTITGATVTGGTVRTSSSGARVEMTSGRASEVVFYDASAERASLSGYISSGNKLNVNGAGISVDLNSQFDADVDVLGKVSTVGLLVGTQTGDPPANYVRLYKDANNLMAKAPGRTAVVVAAL